VDSVKVYLDGPMDAGGTLLGTATYGGLRADVAVALGTTGAANSGFDYVWTPASLDGGPHVLFIYAHSVANGWTYKTVNFTAPAANAQNQPAPSRGFSGGPFDPGPGNPQNNYNQNNGNYNNNNNGNYNNNGYNGQNNYGQGYGNGYGGGTPYGGSFLNNSYNGNGGGYMGGYMGGCNGGPCGGGPYGTNFQPQTPCPIYSTAQSQVYGPGGPQPCGGVNPWQNGSPFMGF